MSSMSSSFFTHGELEELGFKSFGANAQVSRFARIYNAAAISIGNNVRIDDFCILSGGSGIELGNYVHIAAYCALYGRHGLIVRDFCGISARTTIYTDSDDYSGFSLTGPTVPEKYRTRMQSGRVVVEKHGIIGVGTTVMPGVVVGEGTAIGAHSFVIESCEPWSIYAGIPAIWIKERSAHLLELARQLEMESGTSSAR
jgi:dTDP-4-amino-4,6-dideoxy-D-glucose acyltransferase